MRGLLYQLHGGILLIKLGLVDYLHGSNFLFVYDLVGTFTSDWREIIYIHFNKTFSTGRGTFVGGRIWDLMLRDTAWSDYLRASLARLSSSGLFL